MRVVTQVRQLGVGAVCGAAIVCLSAAPAMAQQIEASFEGGYTASEGINLTQSRPVLGNVYNSLDITSGGSYGFTIGAFLGPSFEIEFLWHRQSSTLEASDPAPARKIISQDVDNYLANFVYNWGDSKTMVRPFVSFGLGATHYAPGDYDSSLPGAATLPRIDGFSKFAGSLGGGVKLYPAHNVGVKGTVRWTPTYIKSDAGGLWCDPFYPTCWVVGDPDYSNQFEFSGGITFRFGGR